MKVAILGSSGYLGQFIFRHLAESTNWELLPVVRRLGTAWPILRFGVVPLQADVADYRGLRDAVIGCDVVVNCSLGASAELEANIRSIIKACINADVKQLIHFSSVTVYGDELDESAALESGPELAVKNTYGWYKARQDRLVENARKRGLKTVTFCPPHITGPRCRFFFQVLDQIKRNRFALIDEGKYACNLVDVANLCAATRIAIQKCATVPGRIFVTNHDDYTWADLTRQACHLLGIDQRTIPSLTHSEFTPLRTEPGMSLIQFLRSQIASPTFVADLKRTRFSRSRSFALLKNLLRSANISSRSASTHKPTDAKHAPNKLLLQQLRGIRHKIDKLETHLGSFHLVKSHESFARFADTYQTDRGYNGSFADMYALINDDPPTAVNREL